LVNDLEVRSCVMPVSAAQGRSIVTLEGLPAWYAARKLLKQAPSMHPVQQAMIDEQAVQCGYCYNGMITKAAELLAKNAHPNEAEIRAAMNGHICRSVGRFSDAEPLYCRAVAIFEETLGLDHPHVIVCRDNYARRLNRSNSAK
jgi:aerobic-type carbon monoxide dehydrogenase small subunit (CoxS/CutS family)